MLGKEDSAPGAAFIAAAAGAVGAAGATSATSAGTFSSPGSSDTKVQMTMDASMKENQQRHMLRYMPPWARNAKYGSNKTRGCVTFHCFCQKAAVQTFVKWGKTIKISEDEMAEKLAATTVRNHADKSAGEWMQARHLRSALQLRPHAHVNVSMAMCSMKPWKPQACHLRASPVTHALACACLPRVGSAGCLSLCGKCAG